MNIKIKGLGLVTAFFIGGLLPLGFAPFNLWWLSILSVGCFPLILGQSSGFLRGWAYGAGVYIVGVSWVYVSLAEHTTAGPIPAALATILLGLCLGLFFAALGFIHQKIPHRHRSPLTTISLWVAFEWIRSWLFTGFPWLYLGYAALESSIFEHWIPIIGIYGCSFLMGLWGIVLVKALNQYRLSRTPPPFADWPIMLFLIGLPLAQLGLSQIEWTSESKTTLKVALIQGNIAQEDKWATSKAEMINNRYLQQTHFALEDGAELVIWPEAAVPHLYSLGQNVLEDARTMLRQAPQNPELISGILTDDQPSASPNKTTLRPRSWAAQPNSWPTIRNSVLKISENNKEDRLYHKQNLVPFGEYLPFAQTLVWIFPFLEAFKHGITKGPEQQSPFYAKGWFFQTLICYEIAFPELAFDQARRNTSDQQSPLVDAILTVSNDGWFGLSHGPSQHFEMARFRAKEFGRPVIRATNTGITGVIDSHGEILSEAPREQLAALTQDIKKITGETPYSQIGPRLVLLTVLSLWLLSLLIPPRVRRMLQISQ